METTARLHFLLNPRFQVIATWGWNFVGNFLVIALATILLPDNITVDQQAMQANPRLALIPIAGEIIAAGLLPVLFAIFGRENLAEYGLQMKGFGKGLILSVLAVAILAGAALLGIGNYGPISLSGLKAEPIWHFLSFVAGAFAYGPLEVFFVIWLVRSTDHIFHSEDKILSRGLVITILIYGLLHAFSQGFYSIVIAARYLAFGLIYKATGNSYGPMLAGTVTNEYVWFLFKVFLMRA